MNLAERLADLLGADCVSRAGDLDVDGLRAAVAVSPGTLEHIAAVLRLAAEAGAAVTPWGGGTQQRLGPPPERLDVVVRTHRLKEIVEWEPADLTACLQTGLTLAAVQVRLAEHGQQLPIDAPDADQATLGGLVATNTSGPRRWRYGGWRDLIVGMHMALADGSTAKSGGKVVKNVQGYDLAKLFIGSLGTLGVIGQINVKLAPLPASRRMLVARGELNRISAFLAAVAASTVRATAIDLANAAAAGSTGLPVTNWGGLVLFEGNATVVNACSAAAVRMAESESLRTDAVEGEQLGAVWQRWVDVGRTSDLSHHEAVLTVNVRPGDVSAAARALVDATERRAVSARTWARAGNGVVYARLAADESADPGVALAGVQAELLGRWPATTLVAGDSMVERLARPWGADPAGLAQMRAIKQHFDPAGILQPGRFVGGI